MPRSSARRHCRRHTCPPPRPGSFIHGDGLPPLPYPYRRCHHPPCLFCLVRHYYLYQQDAASLVRANNKEEERRKRAMSVPGAVAADAVAAECYFCGGAAAVVYCRADAAALCLACDRQVHAANTVSCRHARAPLCAACRSAAATVRRGAARFFCSNCDFEKQQQEEERGEPTQPPPPLHDGGAVESYTGCPSACELAAFLGVAGGDKAAEAWWPAWEEPQVLTFDDVLVETNSCHGLRPLLTTSSPKSRSPAGGELDGEVLRQLGELAKSEEAAAYVEETEPAGVDQLPPWESSDYDIGHGDLGALGAETIACVTASLHIPSCQHHEARISADCNAGAQQEQVSASSSAEPSQTSFVELSEVCPGLSRSGSSADDVPNHDHPSPAPVAAPAQPAQATKNVGGYDVVYPDRDRVISRYKEKRKNRIFGKQIRYESRKARADGRVRINGRFAKTS